MPAIDELPDSPVTTTGRLRTIAGWLDPGEPHPYRGPFTRWPRIADGVLALIVFFGSLAAVAASAIDDGDDLTLGAIADRPSGAVALLAVAATSLWWRRSHPIGVTSVVLAVLIAWALAGYGDGQDLAVIIASYSVGRYCADPDRNLVAVGAIAGIGIVGTVIDTSQRIDVAPALLLAAAPWYVGRLVRNRVDYLVLLRERAERLEAEQHARARQAVADERARIARELHDVVAHRVSMMTVQAGAAKTVARHDLDAAVEAMGDVEGAGRRALGELRHLLGVLRPDTADPDHLGPQPGIADVPALVDELAQTGAQITQSVVDSPDHLSAAVDLSAYRIVQEAVTNIIKHAGPNPIVDVKVDVDDGALVIDVVNTTSGAVLGLPESGFGIAGMRERANLLGGTLTAGPHSPASYRVLAHLPLESEPE